MPVPERFSRTALIIGGDGVERLADAKVIVFGVGGVGSFVAEALARGGIGTLTLVDADTVSESNINRQLVALDSTVGRYKAEVMKERIHDINPQCNVTVHNLFFSHENASDFCLERYDYAVDAIDSVTSKLELAVLCSELHIALISSMGAGNKLNPTAFEVTDIYKTSVCPLARVMRHELRKRNIPALKVVYSKEEPITQPPRNDGARTPPGSISFVPSAAGLIIASEVIKDILH